MKSLANCAYRFHQLSNCYLGTAHSSSDSKNHLKIITNEMECIDTALSHASSIDTKKLTALNFENNGLLLDILEESYEKIVIVG